MHVALERRVRELEKDVKKIKEILQLAEVLNPITWEVFNDRQRRIIKYLLSKKYAGATTTEIAKAIGLDNPKSGRTIIWRELKRIQRISKRMKGDPIVVCEGKRWTMNYDDFTFEDVENDRTYV